MGKIDQCTLKRRNRFLKSIKRRKATIHGHVIIYIHMSETNQIYILKICFRPCYNILHYIFEIFIFFCKISTGMREVMSINHNMHTYIGI